MRNLVLRLTRAIRSVALNLLPRTTNIPPHTSLTATEIQRPDSSTVLTLYLCPYAATATASGGDPPRFCSRVGEENFLESL